MQANRVYQVNNGYKYDKNSKKEIQEKDIQDCRLTWRNAVINDSIFSRYMLKHGVRVSKKESVDLISMKFEYSVPQYSEKELCCDENEKPDGVQDGVSTKILEKITIPMVLILHGINMIKQQGCQFQKQMKISVIKCLCGVLAKLKKASAFL